MPKFSIDPAELEAEIRALPITFEPLPSPADQQLSPADEFLVAELFPKLVEGSGDAIRSLQDLVERYPEVPSLKNHLSTAYYSAGRHRKGKKINDLLRRENPDYLFGHLNHAGDLLDRPQNRQRIPEILGETLRLGDFKPDVKLFHESEVRGYYNVVAHFHLEEGRPQSAMAICKQLLASTLPDDPQLLMLLKRIAMANLDAMQQRLADDDACAISTTVPPIPKTLPDDIAAPEFHHPEIAALYRHGFEMPRATIAGILALPRATLIADLEAVLQDSIARAPHFLWGLKGNEENENSFALHAIYFLGELKAAEALPTVLDALSLHSDGLDHWYGDFLHESLWEPLLHLVESQLDAARNFMHKPGIPYDGRDAVALAVARLALFQPDRRGEVRDWFRSVLEFLLDSPPEDNVLDTRLITNMISEVADLHALELLPLITSHYEKGYVAESHIGTLEALTASMNGAPSTQGRPKLMRLEARYSTIASPHPPNRPPQGLAAKGWEEDPQSEPKPPATPALKVGRNDPCPCGSGKKHKKCCL